MTAMFLFQNGYFLGDRFEDVDFLALCHRAGGSDKVVVVTKKFHLLKIVCEIFFCYFQN